MLASVALAGSLRDDDCVMTHACLRATAWGRWCWMLRFACSRKPPTTRRMASFSKLQNLQKLSLQKPPHAWRPRQESLCPFWVFSLACSGCSKSTKRKSTCHKPVKRQRWKSAVMFGAYAYMLSCNVCLSYDLPFLPEIVFLLPPSSSLPLTQAGPHKNTCFFHSHAQSWASNMSYYPEKICQVNPQTAPQMFLELEVGSCDRKACQVKCPNFRQHNRPPDAGQECPKRFQIHVKLYLDYMSKIYIYININTHVYIYIYRYIYIYMFLFMFKSVKIPNCMLRFHAETRARLYTNIIQGICCVDFLDGHDRFGCLMLWNQETRRDVWEALPRRDEVQTHLARYSFEELWPQMQLWTMVREEKVKFMQLGLVFCLSFELFFGVFLGGGAWSFFPWVACPPGGMLCSKSMHWAWRVTFLRPGCGRAVVV